jgi:hypothetical protein
MHLMQSIKKRSPKTYEYFLKILLPLEEQIRGDEWGGARAPMGTLDLSWNIYRKETKEKG